MSIAAAGLVKLLCLGNYTSWLNNCAFCNLEETWDYTSLVNILVKIITAFLIRKHLSQPQIGQRQYLSAIIDDLPAQTENFPKSQQLNVPQIIPRNATRNTEHYFRKLKFDKIKY